MTNKTLLQKPGIRWALAAVLALCLLVGCATPKAVEEHHHHYYNADTAAVRAQVDSRMSSSSLMHSNW